MFNIHFPFLFWPSFLAFAMNRASPYKTTMLVVLGLLSLFLVVQNCHAYQFEVDWSLASSSSYDQWAQQSRFQTGDILMFSYQANQDSVLQVSEGDYKNCNTASPIAKYSDGHTAINLTQSGPHYFISGVVDHCKKNEKIVIVVLANRSNRSSNTPPPSVSPSVAPSPAPVSHEIPSPPPAPVTPEIDMTPAPAPVEDNPSPHSKNGGSSVVKSFICSFGGFVGLSLVFGF